MQVNIQNWNAKESIMATLAYFDIFDLALNAEEIRRYVLGRMLSKDELKENLAKLLVSKKIEEVEGFYCLAGRGEILELRQIKHQIAEKFRHWSYQKQWLFGFVPFIKGVYLCNNLSYDGVTKNSDIDIFVVTQRGRIFLTRTILTVLAHLFGVRRHGNKIVKRFCLSLYVSEDALNMENLLISRGDIYMAYWMLGLEPLVGNVNMVIKENSWLNRFFGQLNQRISGKNLSIRKNWLAKFSEFILARNFGDLLEIKLAKYFKKRYLINKASLGEKASVIVSERVLKYHNLDRRADFKKSWEERLERLELLG